MPKKSKWAEWGEKGGSSKSKKKVEAARSNGTMPVRLGSAPRGRPGRKPCASGCACHPCVLSRMRARGFGPVID